MQLRLTASAVLFFAVCARGQVTGTVRDSESGLAIAGAKVLLTGAKEVQTDQTGTFRFDPVRPGKYVIYYRKEKYDDGSAAVEVKPGGATVTLKMRPYAEMEGVVRDEDGKPLEGVNVYVGGLRDSTDKAGHYRAQDISAGTYTIALRLPFALRRRTALRNEKRGETFGYGYTLYYPGVTDRSLAAPVAISPGARYTNFDIRLRRTRLVEMKGKLLGAPAAAEVELDSRNGLPEGAYDKRVVDEDGGFRFDLLEPGDYTVVVHRNRPGDDLPYLAPVHLGETGVQDLEVVVPPFARIEGMVRTGRADLRWEGVVRVMLEKLGYDTEARCGPDGKFVLNAVPPGEWNLTVDSSLAHRAGDAARRMALNTAPPKSLRVTESGNAPLELVLTDEIGRITGMADEPGLVTVSQDGGSLRSSRAVMTGTDGSFLMEVAPGKYAVGMAGAASCSKTSESVTVAAGGTVSVHLKACSTERIR